MMVKLLQVEKDRLSTELFGMQEHGVIAFVEEKHKLDIQLKSGLEAVAIAEGKLSESEQKLTISRKRIKELVIAETEARKS